MVTLASLCSESAAALANAAQWRSWLTQPRIQRAPISMGAGRREGSWFPAGRPPAPTPCAQRRLGRLPGPAPGRPGRPTVVPRVQLEPLDRAAAVITSPTSVMPGGASPSTRLAWPSNRSSGQSRAMVVMSRSISQDYVQRPAHHPRWRPAAGGVLQTRSPPACWTTWKVQICEPLSRARSRRRRACASAAAMAANRTRATPATPGRRPSPCQRVRTR